MKNIKPFQVSFKEETFTEEYDKLDYQADLVLSLIKQLNDNKVVQELIIKSIYKQAIKKGIIKPKKDK